MSSGRVFTLPRSCLQYFTLSLQREQAVTRTEKEERQSRWVGRGGAIGRKGFRVCRYFCYEYNFLVTE